MLCTHRLTPFLLYWNVVKVISRFIVSSYDKAKKYYSKARDYLSLVRIACFKVRVFILFFRCTFLQIYSFVSRIWLHQAHWRVILLCSIWLSSFLILTFLFSAFATTGWLQQGCGDRGRDQRPCLCLPLRQTAREPGWVCFYLYLYCVIRWCFFIVLFCNDSLFSTNYIVSNSLYVRISLLLMCKHRPVQWCDYVLCEQWLLQPQHPSGQSLQSGYWADEVCCIFLKIVFGVIKKLQTPLTIFYYDLFSSFATSLNLCHLDMPSNPRLRWWSNVPCILSSAGSSTRPCSSTTRVRTYCWLLSYVWSFAWAERISCMIRLFISNKFNPFLNLIIVLCRWRHSPCPGFVFPSWWGPQLCQQHLGLWHAQHHRAGMLFVSISSDLRSAVPNLLYTWIGIPHMLKLFQTT